MIASRCPVLLSAVIVFVASCIIHADSPRHKNDEGGLMSRAIVDADRRGPILRLRG